MFTQIVDVCMAISKLFTNKKPSPTQGTTLNVGGSVIGSPIASGSNITQNVHFGSSPNKTQSLKSLSDYDERPTPIEILTELDNAPPFQRNTLARGYRGIKVRWPVVFRNIIQHPDNRELYKVCTRYRGAMDGSEVICDLRIEDFPRLQIAKANEPLIITGTIAALDDWVLLRDAHIYFLEETSPTDRRLLLQQQEEPKPTKLGIQQQPGSTLYFEANTSGIPRNYFEFPLVIKNDGTEKSVIKYFDVQVEGNPRPYENLRSLALDHIHTINGNMHINNSGLLGDAKMTVPAQGAWLGSVLLELPAVLLDPRPKHCTLIITDSNGASAKQTFDMRLVG